MRLSYDRSDGYKYINETEAPFRFVSVFQCNLVQPEGESGPLPQLGVYDRLLNKIGEVIKGHHFGLKGHPFWIKGHPLS
jgi:hypothetical protein